MRRTLERALCLALCLCLLAGGCAVGGPQRYTEEFYGAFDTVITLTAYLEDEQDFEQLAQLAQQRLTAYSQMYDIYVPYAGVKGLYQVNEQAGQGPVEVEPQVIELLQFAQECYELTEGRVNVAMGSVLRIWHDLREAAGQDPDNARLPQEAQLREAAEHTKIEDMVLDAENNTVELRDPAMRLDVGSVAKGYAVQRVTEELKQAGYTDFVLSAGGNVEAAGTPPDRPTWSVGIEDPRQTGALAATVEVTDEAVVTSGGYQRFYTVDGRQYHHIVDPDTLYPAEKMLSATVIYPDSGLADCMSTALFLMEPEQALAFAGQWEGMRVILVTLDGEVLDSAS